MEWIFVNILYACAIFMVIVTIIEALITFVIEPIIDRIKWKRKLKQRFEKD